MTETMLRYNKGKPPLALVPTSFIRVLDPGLVASNHRLVVDVAHVLGFGANKYSANNWRKSGSWLSVLDCAFRHIRYFTAGQPIDPESGLHHLAHAGCNLAFLTEFIDQGSGLDDRCEVKKKWWEGEPANTYIKLLMAWKDGADHQFLYDAIKELSNYYNTLPGLTIDSNKIAAKAITPVKVPASEIDLIWFCLENCP